MNGSVTGSVGETPDAILDQEDVPYPCKGCGEVNLPHSINFSAAASMHVVAIF